jgi:hypothetical protein
MLTFTKSEDSRKIARIKGGKHHKQYLYITNDENTTNGVHEVKLTDGKLQILPNKDIVEKIYVSAPSGAGKSTFCGSYMKEYRKIFKDSEIYVFSSITQDRVLDRNNPIRIQLDEDLVNDPINPIEIPNSLVLFDDIDTLRNPRLKKTLHNLRDWLLEQGRHYDIRMLITSHLLSDYTHTRRILNEATTVVVFPKSGSGTFHIKRFLKTYCGFDKKQISKFLNLPSRWVAIYRSYPQYVVHEKGAYFAQTNEYD